MAMDEFQPAADVTPNPTPAERKPPVAWQPFTPRGIAAFASVPAGRLFAVQLVLAAISSLVVLWFLATAWFPVVRGAIETLPDTGALQARQLTSPYDSPEPLAMNRFFAAVLDTRNRVTATVAADVVVECRAREFRVCSLFGCYISPYPASWQVEFNRTGLLALWEAWRPHLLWMAAAATVAWLMIVWTLLAMIYAPAVKCVALVREREASLAACWRLAGAALMPGALLALASIVLYGLGALDLIEFLVLAGLHVLVAWVFLFLPVKHLPLRAGAVVKGKNPFQPVGSPEPAGEMRPSEEGAGDDSSPSSRGGNPFTGPGSKS